MSLLTGMWMTDLIKKAFKPVKTYPIGSFEITGDTGLTAFEFASKYQQVGGAGSHVYTPRPVKSSNKSKRGFITGWGEMPLEDAAKLSTLLGKPQAQPSVGGAGMALTTGYGKAQGLWHKLSDSSLGLPPKVDDDGDGGKLVSTVIVGWILYKVLL